jgi:diguanylate cyclase (GGDEF)-like protein
MSTQLRVSDVVRQRNVFLFCSVFTAAIVAVFFISGRVSATIVLLSFFIFLAVMNIPNRMHLRRLREIDLRRQAAIEKINMLSSEIRKKEQLLQNVPRQIERLNFFKSMVERLIKVKELEDVYRTVVSQIRSSFDHADVILIYQLHRGVLKLAYSYKDERLTQHIKNKVGDILDYWVIKQNKELVIEDVRHDFRFDPDRIEALGEREIGSLIVSPMLMGKTTVGVIRVESTKTRNFGFDDLRILSVIADITALCIDRLHLVHKVQELAIKDSLTGLYLRNYFMERMQLEVRRALIDDHPLSVLMVDIDCFKCINDEHGHIVGDMVLKSLAQLMMETISGEGRLVGRYGGEEFIAVLPGACCSAARDVAEKLRQVVENGPVPYRRKKIAYTISVGVACFPQDAKLEQDLIRVSDDALYRAKSEGRNRVCMASCL